MDNLLLIALFLVGIAVFANLAVVHGVDSRDGFGRRDATGLL